MHLIFEKSVEELCHVIAVIRSAKLSDCVHGKGGIADINGKYAVFGGNDRADGSSALNVASVVENLIGDIVLFTKKLEYGGASGGGCIGLRVCKLQNRTFVCKKAFANAKAFCCYSVFSP